MTPESRQTILSFHAIRLPYKAIIKVTGFSSATIYRVLREDCIPPESQTPLTKQRE